MLFLSLKNSFVLIFSLRNFRVTLFRTVSFDFLWNAFWKIVYGLCLIGVKFRGKLVFFNWSAVLSVTRFFVEKMGWILFFEKKKKKFEV